MWPVVEDVLSSGGRDRRSNRMQVIRVRTDNDLKIVGEYYGRLGYGIRVFGVTVDSKVGMVIGVRIVGMYGRCQSCCRGLIVGSGA